MNFGYREVCLDHDTGERHPESPDRLRAVRRALKNSHGVEYVDADDAALDLIRRVHDEDYVEEYRILSDTLFEAVEDVRYRFQSNTEMQASRKQSKAERVLTEYKEAIEGDDDT